MGYCVNANGGKGGECPHLATRKHDLCIKRDCPGWDYKTWPPRPEGDDHETDAH